MPVTPDQARAELARRELARRGVSTDEKTDWKGVVGSAVKDSFQKPARYLKDLGTNPESMAHAMPGLMGAAGGLSPVPGGATIGTGAGQVVQDIALSALKKPIPSGLQHGLELGGAAIGDISAIPAIKSAHYGAQIGQAEKAAGLGNIVKEAPPSGMRTAVKYVQSLKGKPFMSVQEARSIKPALQTIWDKGWLRGTEYEADLFKVQTKINKLLNQIPGRAEPVAAMGKAMTIPRMISKGYKAIPSQFKRGASYGTGAAAAGMSVYEIMKKIMGQ